MFFLFVSVPVILVGLAFSGVAVLKSQVELQNTEAQVDLGMVPLEKPSLTARLAFHKWATEIQTKIDTIQTKK